MPDVRESLLAYVRQLASSLSELPVDRIRELIQLIDDARMSKASVFVFGNGGSAATATHFACDLAKGAIVPSLPRVRATCLTDATSLLTAWSNDEAYERAIGEMLRTYAGHGDVAIAISSSGRSPNVLNAVEAARELGVTTVGLSGFDGGKLRGLVDLPVHIDTSVIEHVEDLHDIVHHMVTMGLRLEHVDAQ